jgi:hypothetical protein
MAGNGLYALLVLLVPLIPFPVSPLCDVFLTGHLWQTFNVQIQTVAAPQNCSDNLPRLEMVFHVFQPHDAHGFKHTSCFCGSGNVFQGLRPAKTWLFLRKLSFTL